MTEAADIVILAGDAPLEVLGQDERDAARLHVAGVQATLDVLDTYFRLDQDEEATRRAVEAQSPPFVSLNGAYLEQFLQDAGFSTALITNVSAESTRLDALLERQPMAVVISTTFFPFAKQINAVAARVKSRAPATTVIAGGIQVWKSFRHRQLHESGLIAPELVPAVSEHNYLMDKHADSPVDIFIVSDRGEDTLARVLQCLRAGRDYHGLENLAYGGGEGWTITTITDEPQHEISMDWSRYSGDTKGAYVPIQAGLGCRFGCAFCDFSGLRPVQSRSVDSLVEEIRTIAPGSDGLRRVYFTDDNLFPSRRRVEEICGALIRENLDVRWRGLCRIDILDDAVAEMMAHSGCLEVLLGVESGDASMLKAMQKHVTPEQILAGVESLSRQGIHTKSTFIVGYPGETDQTVKNTIELLNAYPEHNGVVHRYLLFLFAVLPLSRVAQPELREQTGLEGYGYHWRHATMDASRASKQIVRIQKALKTTLSPSYVMEVPEHSALSRRAMHEVFVLRNELARLQGCGATDKERALWDRMREYF
ncbi:MAG: radical SAM protein [Kiritimatiellae bacterium]|nr:radical SAM protein [Kiritimatiellia bacterium]